LSHELGAFIARCLIANGDNHDKSSPGGAMNYAPTRWRNELRPYILFVKQKSRGDFLCFPDMLATYLLNLKRPTIMSGG
jgi:hypothetical protein